MAATTYNGWFIGAGAEAMLPWFPGLSLKSEYRFAADHPHRAGLPLWRALRRSDVTTQKNRIRRDR